jgi:hypothetical protein
MKLVGWTVWNKKRGFGTGGLQYPQSIYPTRAEARRKTFKGEAVVKITLRISTDSGLIK